MKEKQTIKKLYLDGLSKRKIALLTKKSRNTVDKYIKEYERNRTIDKREFKDDSGSILNCEMAHF
ncbi:helix-turn-helix domain-containing protein [Globicatella sulfidifaciens]|uniref:DUF1670 domain-containing protein n=1 Tax=Globicatella sulfidifaciens TaxID=136093 RepID=UPI0028911CF3|nr:DUF1670 domain-containing protein [Globicatella sulfidifaciens]MDT2768234.1 helix-turn-helix domain-containing protein [Globicatella sulfidifaciens]